MKESNFISVVIYYRNAIEGMDERFAKKLYGDLLTFFENYEVIIVNNAEKENDVRRFTECLNKHVKHNTITVINFTGSIGRESAMIAGDDFAVGDYIFEFDNISIEFKSGCLMEAYNTLMRGYDVVSVGSEEIKNPLGTKLFYWLYNSGVAKEQQIRSEVFRIISRRAFNRARAMTKTLSFRKGVYAEGGLKRCYLEEPSLKILKKPDDKDIDQHIRLGISALMVFTDTMQKISTIVCGLFLLATVAISFYIVYVFLIQKPVEGWTPIMLYLSIGFFGIFVILAIILKFLSEILNIVYKNETHNVESITKV